jgi:hypothetical protein
MVFFSNSRARAQDLSPPAHYNGGDRETVFMRAYRKSNNEHVGKNNLVFEGGSDSMLDVRLGPCNHVYAFCGAWWDLIGERKYFDAVIHAIAVLNHSSRSISVNSVTVEAIREDRLVQLAVIDEEEIERLTKPVVDKIKLGLGKLINLILWVDQVVPPEISVSSTLNINPNTALVIPNYYMVFQSLPDTLKVTVYGQDERGKAVKTSASLRVIEHRSKVKYTLPVEGAWLMKAMPITGIINHHRFGCANEFGIDLLRLGSNCKVFKSDGKLASDYFSFGAKVLAAADGIVVRAKSSSSQEWSRFNPAEGETVEAFQERQMREMLEGLQGDILQWVAGNYIVIEHSENEYSSYLHLRENSVRVKEGETLKRGQHIADVGNTGDSYSAHLHFQVNDSPDLLRGRSLPFTFENIEIELMEAGQFIRARSF